VSHLRSPLTWAIIATVAGLASSPAAHYPREGVVFALGGASLFTIGLLRRPAWRSILIWGWMLDATLMLLAGLMFRISSPTTPSGATVFVLCGVVGFGTAWAFKGADGASRAPGD
jgi:hypothetical protein